MRKQWSFGLSALILALSLAPSLEGSMLTYILEGTVTAKTDDSHLLDLLQIQDTVKYTILIDSNTPNLNGTPGLSRYGAMSADLQLGAYAFGCEVPWVWVIADWSANPASVFSVPVFTSFFGAPASGSFDLIDYQKSSIPTSDLPSVPYDLTLFDVKSFSFTVTNPAVYGDYSYISGTFDSFKIIPEPASFWLFGIVSLVMAVRTRSTRRSFC